MSQQLRTGVGNNHGHYSNAQFDKLVDQADVDPDLAQRLPLYYGKANLLFSSKVSGLVVTPQGIF